MGSQPVPLVTLCIVVVAVVVLSASDVYCGFVQQQKKSEEKNSTLELLHVVFRHGPRTPVTTYPNDPYINEAFFPYGWGHLTNDAKRELFKIGSWLRKRYAKTIGPYYKNDLLHAQSSASPRTMMSLATVLAGMFPPGRTPMEWNSKFNWQPIPIYTEPLDQDILLRMTATCPRYEQAQEEVLQLPEVQAELQANAKLFSALTEVTGMNVTRPIDVNSIYITFLAELGYGLKLPDWAPQYFPDQMEFMASQSYIYDAYNTEMKRIKGGPFLEKMLREMQQKAAGTLQPSDRSIYMYCAHDWSIINILAALNVWERRMPRFSAMAMFELHKNPETGVYYVEIYFKNDPNGKSEKLTVPGCDFQCPLEKLVELSKDVMPSGTYQEMCAVPQSA